jgi:hypothetical protein
MERRDTVTRTVQVLDILPGDPPQILTAERLRRNGRPGRLFQQLVPVPDNSLFARLTAQVSKGDTITITVVTEWRATDYRSYLCEFVPSSSSSDMKPEEVRA